MVRSAKNNAQPHGRRQAALAALVFCVCFIWPAALQAAVTDSVRFFVLDQFLNQSPSSDITLAVTDPIDGAVRASAEYYGVSTPIADEFIRIADGLRIPDAFEPPSAHSEDLYNHAVARLAQAGLSYTISFPASFADAEHSAAEAIVVGHPVLALHPRPILLFGYDYREPDPFWYVQRFSPAAEIEIVTRSQWRADWWLWEPDPASVTLLEITGRDSTTRAIPTPEQVLEQVLTAAKTDTAAGTTSYIRPLLHLQDTLAKATVTPQLVNVQSNSFDPLYLLKAGGTRLQLQSYLKSLLPQARDTVVGQSLRLAIYSAGKAAEEYTAAARELYGDSAPAGGTDSVTIVDIIADRWVEHRLEAAKRIAEAIRWERQMLAAIKEFTAMKKPFQP